MYFVIVIFGWNTTRTEVLRCLVHFHPVAALCYGKVYQARHPGEQESYRHVHLVLLRISTAVLLVKEEVCSRLHTQTRMDTHKEEHKSRNVWVVAYESYHLRRVRPFYSYTLITLRLRI